MIGEVIGLLQSPAKRVIAALLHHHEQKAEGTAVVAEVIEAAPEAPVAEAPAADAPAEA